ncbi:MAG: two pore domain potassium channel family protein [Phenylobacterium sp.]|uniref:ion channel n=1 Tax=Phenylobacterium sp. TaxID=1871053 RepID=UPI0011FA58CE|nr:ion channel [Phenylobacterium sp.]TAJ71434.1 MAG: two pore domain potassium channel family protein [Phenylobacterium sp.]
MLVELLFATGMVALTVVIHGVGLALLGRVTQAEENAKQLDWLSARGVGFTVGLVLGLFLLHGLEIWLYAVLYHLLGAVGDVRSAVYFSTTTYAAIGYGDEVMAPRWRLLGGIEGINGVILLGWSTAFFVTIMSGLRLRRGKGSKT